MAHSFNFSGRFASAPTLTNHAGKKVCKFTLISNEYAGKDKENGEALERALSIQFTAFDGKAEAIAAHCFKGDQLNLWNVKLQNNNHQKEGVDVYGYNFIVDDFEFGAPGSEKRKQLDAQRQG